MSVREGRQRVESRERIGSLGSTESERELEIEEWCVLRTKIV